MKAIRLINLCVLAILVLLAGFMIVGPPGCAPGQIIEQEQITLEKVKAWRGWLDRQRVFLGTQMDLVREFGDEKDVKFLDEKVQPVIDELDEGIEKFKKAVALWEGLGVGSPPPEGVGEAEHLIQKAIEGAVMLTLLLT